MVQCATLGQGKTPRAAHELRRWNAIAVCEGKSLNVIGYPGELLLRVLKVFEKDFEEMVRLVAMRRDSHMPATVQEIQSLEVSVCRL